MTSTPNRRRTDPDDSRPLELLAMVVDDDEASCSLTAARLKSIGVDAVTETHPDKVRAIMDDRAFDLAVLDLRMAPLTGLDLIQQLRRAPYGADMYCILLTAHDELETRVAALSSGFDDVISKSMPDAELKAKLLAAKRIVARQRKLDLAVSQLRSLANQDALTGLFNRRFLFEEMDRILARRRAPLHAVLFDLDDFKVVNDTHGHLLGDRVLRDVAAVFLQETREHDLIGRYGGDEFLLLVENATVEDTEEVAKRLSSAISALRWTVEGATFSVSATFGIGSSDLLDPPSPAALVHVCDRDLYKSKYLRRSAGGDFAYEYSLPQPGEVTPLAAAEEQKPPRRRQI